MGKSRGMGFIDWLQLSFIILRLCNVITWKWTVVLAPYIVVLMAIIASATIEFVKEEQLN